MSDRWYSEKSQISWVVKNLVEGRTLSTIDEISEVKGWRLAAVIHTLKSNYGWPILSEGRGKVNVEHYWLSPKAHIANLKFPPSAVWVKDELGLV